MIFIVFVVWESKIPRFFMPAAVTFAFDSAAGLPVYILMLGDHRK